MSDESKKELENLKEEIKKLKIKIRKLEIYCHSFPGAYKYPTTDDSNIQEEELFEEAVKVVAQYDKASVSFLQRRLQIGFNRSARLIEQLEETGVVGPAEGSAPRNVLIKDAKSFLDELKGKED